MPRIDDFCGVFTECKENDDIKIIRKHIDAFEIDEDYLINLLSDVFKKDEIDELIQAYNQQDKNPLIIFNEMASTFNHESWRIDVQRYTDSKNDAQLWRFGHVLLLFTDETVWKLPEVPLVWEGDQVIREVQCYKEDAISYVLVHLFTEERVRYFFDYSISLSLYEYSEICEIIEKLEDDYAERIPQKVRDFFVENGIGKRYIPHIDVTIPLQDQVKRETMVILAVLNIYYWCDTKEEKYQMIRELYKNEGESTENIDYEKWLQDNNPFETRYRDEYSDSYKSRCRSLTEMGEDDIPERDTRMIEIQDLEGETKDNKEKPIGDL